MHPPSVLPPLPYSLSHSLRSTHIEARNREDRRPQQREGIVVNVMDLIRHGVALSGECIRDGEDVVRESAVVGFVDYCRRAEEEDERVGGMFGAKVSPACMQRVSIDGSSVHGWSRRSEYVT